MAEKHESRESRCLGFTAWRSACLRLKQMSPDQGSQAGGKRDIGDAHATVICVTSSNGAAGKEAALRIDPGSRQIAWCTAKAAHGQGVHGAVHDRLAGEAVGVVGASGAMNHASIGRRAKAAGFIRPRRAMSVIERSISATPPR